MTQIEVERTDRAVERAMSVLGDPTLTGEVVRVRFKNEETGFAVIVIAAEEGDVTAAGDLAGLRPGDRVRVWGERAEHARYGDQVKATEVRIDLPASADGIRRYLMRFDGIGGVAADALVRVFGDDALRVAIEEPGRLIEALSPAKAIALAQAIKEEAGKAEQTAELLALGLQARFVNKALRKWGAETATTIRQNPYLLEDLDGIGFKLADEVAMRVGFELSHPLRLRAGIAHVLKEASKRGHTYLPANQVNPKACKLLRVKLPTLDQELAAMEEDGRVVVDGEAVYLAGLWRAEEGVAANLRRLASEASSGDLELVAKRAIEVFAVDGLDEVQKMAVRMALTEKVSILTGGPGTGKTTVTRQVVELAQAAGLEVVLCAPTGRAAKRLEEATGFGAATIHRTLRYHPGGKPIVPEDEKKEESELSDREREHREQEREDRSYRTRGWWRHNRAYPLGGPCEGGHPDDDFTGCDLVILDEASMVDVALMLRLLEAIPDGARLLVVGDKDQLPSVQPGAVLRDLIACAKFPVTQLVRVYRQAEGSSILANAHRVNAGVMPVKGDGHREGGDYFQVQKGTPEAALEMAVEMACNRIPARYGLDPTRDVWVLSPMKVGEAGTKAINQVLRERLNPVQYAEDGARRVRAGDRVMQTRNDYTLGVYNGDWGLVQSVDRETGEVVVELNDGNTGRLVKYDKDQAQRLDLAWAATVHKFQGCEVPAIVLVLQTSQFAMLSRRLLYTAMTRARDLLVIVGDEKAIAIAVSDRGGLDKERFALLAARVQRVLTPKVPVAQGEAVDLEDVEVPGDYDQ